MTERAPRREPPLLAVAEYWLTQENRFPENLGFWIGLGEPYCMACRWLAPMQNARGAKTAWHRASGYLHRAHLADRVFGGLDGVQNIVALCHRCHRDMPSFDDGADALAWVRIRKSNTRRLLEEAEYRLDLKILDGRDPRELLET